MTHGVVFLSVLFAGKSLATDTARERLRLDVRASVNVEAAALCELFAASVTRKWPVSGVGSLV